ncbi:hypothetical protein AXYL_04059 [Achromobacter xylosoxidans A8]|uniref:Uncharacterized protein n=1 Tax=Achromobacter xylosoxidans (strain A8) TaxID=762376 RepID=E3HTT9_ACHXA|nr:hypothetical protein [Achromobacter xylosoxidans]ADP17379.1 hypothetical protein AXYL_04059 [Achromobacter xylosoxidans A8]
MSNQNTAAQAATQEAHRIAAADEYFAARTWIMDTNDHRRLFEAGFDRAYTLLSKLRAPVADEHEGFEAWRKHALSWTTPATTGISFAWDAWQERGRRAALASAPVAGEAVAWRVTHSRCPKPGWQDAAREPPPSHDEVKQQDSDLILELAYAAPQASEAVRVHQLEAARIAYAREFPPDENGDPDVGNIHANIRKLKSQLAALSTQPGAQKKREAPNA